MDARGRLACYPRSTFYLLSDGPSIRNTAGSLTPTFVPARLIGLAVRRPSTFALALPDCRPGRGHHCTPPLPFGRRPPQSNCPMSTVPIADNATGEARRLSRLVFHRWLPPGWRPGITASQLCYTGQTSGQCQPAVKVHGVFPSDRGYVVSSPRLQFHRVPRGDSAPVVTPFMQVGTYPTRNFATLGPS